MQMLPTWILLWITYYFDFITSVKPYEAVSRIQFPRSPYNDDEGKYDVKLTVRWLAV